MIVVPLLALVVAGVKRHAESQIAAVEREKQAVIAIEATGASIHFASESKPILSKTPNWLRKFFTEEVYRPVQVVHLNHDNVKQPIDELLYQLKEHLEALTEPERINLTGTDVTDQGLKYLSGMNRLREITMARTQVTDAGLAHLESLSALELLGLEETKVIGHGLIHLRNLNKLIGLELSGNSITDQDLIHLQKMTNLQYLYLSSTAITDRGISSLVELKELKALVLWRTSITNDAVKKICSLPKLKCLYLGNSVNNAAINDLLKIKQLAELGIHETMIDQEGYNLLSTKMPNCVIFWSPRRVPGS